MKFILFFYILSLMVITGLVLGEDTIVESSFYQEYMTDEFVVQENKTLIEKEDIPGAVLQSFAKSPFGELDIKKVYTIPSSASKHWIDYLMISNRVNNEVYVLALADQPNSTQLHFDEQGKLINVENM
ncbi:MAG: hypothetical protein ACLFUB_13285 [Cyclobacteriaceae bacterium]